ncbi:hypothetical protein BC830DRAFT_1084946 [Chytriomyces sp. MP71]|nr:hypothetical protein BC830DRAFT_1084946 [Chytriomyces sp. MP71]
MPAGSLELSKASSFPTRRTWFDYLASLSGASAYGHARSAWMGDSSKVKDWSRWCWNRYEIKGERGKRAAIRASARRRVLRGTYCGGHAFTGLIEYESLMYQ